jgi:hypothetical protein
MNWELLGVVPKIILAIAFMLTVWAGGKFWKHSKFLSLVFFLMAAAVGIGFYALYGKQIFG